MRLGRRAALIALVAIPLAFGVVAMSATAASARSADAKQGLFNTCISGIPFTGTSVNVTFYMECCLLAGGYATVQDNADGTKTFTCTFVSDASRSQLTQGIGLPPTVSGPVYAKPLTGADTSGGASGGASNAGTYGIVPFSVTSSPIIP